MPGKRLGPKLAEFEQRWGHGFRDRWLLLEALTHPGYPPDADFSGNNQRLEFLGDAVLGHLVVERLFAEFGGLAEGPLSTMKSALVSSAVLAPFARDRGVHELLRVGQGFEHSAGFESGLADAVEALVGAMSREVGMDEMRLWRDQVFWPFAWAAMQGVVHTQDAKGALIRWAQAQGMATPKFVDLGMTGPVHAPTFECGVEWRGQIVARGAGRSRKAASAQAAMAALTRIEQEGSLDASLSKE
jgi:ribonuclease-3